LQKAVGLLGLLAGAANDCVEPWHDLERLGLAAVFRHAAFDVAVKILRFGQRMQRRKDALGKTCRGFAPRL
jgi:hypothetical protein